MGLNVSSIQPLNGKNVRAAYAVIVASLLLVALTSVGVANADKPIACEGTRSLVGGSVVILEQRITENGVRIRDLTFSTNHFGCLEGRRDCAAHVVDRLTNLGFEGEVSFRTFETH